MVGAAVLLMPWQSGVLDPKGPVGAAERLILFNATGIMLAVIVPVIVMTLIFAWWFRAGNPRAQRLPNWSYSGRLEFIVWSIPAMVVLFLGGIGWIGAHELDPPRPLASTAKPVEVDVVSLDWKWLFIYPEQGVASVNRLVVPVGRPIAFRLTSATVMNSFFVPELGSQIYLMSGMTTRLHLQADRPGVYPGLSAQFSGDGFSDMRFDVLAESEDGFAAFVARAKAQGGLLDAAGYARLALPSQAVAPATYGAVAPGLFDVIAAGPMSAPTPAMAMPASYPDTATDPGK
ncbi:MAG: ubiquinol oxidase subunit II [Rhizomicrobium sp.]